MSKSKYATRRLAWEAIEIAQARNRRLSDVIAEKLKKVQFNTQNKRFAMELIMGTVRLQGRLDFELADLYRGDYAEINENLKILLRLGAYQIRYMNSVPDYAAVTTIVTLAKTIHPGAAKLTNAILRSYQRTDPKRPDETFDIMTWSQYLSHPIWIVNKWSEQWSFEDAHDLAKWNNKTPKVWFRINPLISNKNITMSYLESKGYEWTFHPILDEYFHVNHTSRLISSWFFRQGNVSVQDPAAGLVVRLLEPHKGETIMDGCAAPGGKTTYISEILQNEGKIIASDNDRRRLDLLRLSISRLHMENVETAEIDMSWADIPSADKYLLDVPCSGTGVMAKRADLRWRRRMFHIAEMVEIQRDILSNVAEKSPAGSTIVYSTCSLEPEENWNLVDDFLLGHPDWVVEHAADFVDSRFVDKKGGLFIFPPDHGIDGAFAVRLKKDASTR